MAKVTRTFHVCDRCKVEMDGPVMGRERGPTRFQMTATQDMGIAGGTLIEWLELCSECNAYLGAVVAEMNRMAKRKQEARRMTDE